MNDTTATIDRIIALHGEEGLSPTRQDWEQIMCCPPDQPIQMLNLLRFKPEVETATGRCTGFAAYSTYSSSVGAAFARVGGKLIYFGRVNHAFGTVVSEPWDAAILTQYPTPQALTDFWLDHEFIAAHHHRTDGVLASLAVALTSFDSGGWRASPGRHS